MSATILDKIFETKKNRVEQAKRTIDRSRLIESAKEKQRDLKRNRFRAAFENRDRLNIIAEFKRASPSKGVINDSVDPASIAAAYQAGGAAAISVLTEEDFFAGSLDDLRTVRATVDLPILRKDFIFDDFQIYETIDAGADAILLIAAMLDDESLSRLHGVADDLSIDALVEVHNVDELERVKHLGAKLIGVNNRDLKTFDVSLDVSRELIKHAPDDAVVISESGLKTKNDLIELHDLDYSGFLIGETLMRSKNPVMDLGILTTEITESTEKISSNTSL